MAHKYFYTYCALSGERSLLFPYLVKTFPPNITSTFKHIGNLKEIYRDHPYTHHLDSTINISLYLFYHILIHLSIPMCIHEPNLFFGCLTK